MVIFSSSLAALRPRPDVRLGLSIVKKVLSLVSVRKCRNAADRDDEPPSEGIPRPTRGPKRAEGRPAQTDASLAEA
jgi:hypothetical protein